MPSTKRLAMDYAGLAKFQGGFSSKQFTQLLLLLLLVFITQNIDTYVSTYLVPIVRILLRVYSS